MDLPRTLAELTPNARNPRKVTPAKLAALKKALDRFGDLGGVVFNVQSGTLVGGHQRRTALGGDCPIVRTKMYDKPTRTGTVAEGYIEVDGEAHRYREVRWSKSVEQAANIAANKGAGEFDNALLGEWFTELEADDFDVGLTMFDAAEIAGLRAEAAPAPVAAEDVVDDLGVAAPAVPTVQVGQCWRLGHHTLYCGDSQHHLAKDAGYDVVFTDPPYGVSYVSRVDKPQGKGWGGIKNDELDSAGLVSLVQACVPDAPYRFICCDWNCYAAFELALGKPRSVCV